MEPLANRAVDPQLAEVSRGWAADPSELERLASLPAHGVVHKHENLLRLVDLRVRCDESAPATARQALDGAGAQDDLTLIASELVTNALLHSGCTEHDEIQLWLERTNHHLRVSVVDPGRSGQSARVAIDEQRASGGMGLFVVEQLASHWGADRSGSYRVWAEVPVGQ